MRLFRKALKALALLVVIVLLALYLYGFRPDVGKVSATVEINRPPEQVWRYLTEDDLLKSWISGLEEVRHVTPGPMGVGTKLALGERYGGELTRMEMTINGFEPARTIKFNIVGGDRSAAFTENGEYVLVDEDSRTRLTLSATSVYNGFLLRLMEPYITYTAQKKVEGDLARLKSLLEAEPRIAAPY